LRLGLFDRLTFRFPTGAGIAIVAGMSRALDPSLYYDASFKIAFTDPMVLW
jgi:hypothetical protein